MKLKELMVLLAAMVIVCASVLDVFLFSDIFG